MDELQKAAAQRWEKLVAGGATKEEATADTQAWLEGQRAQLGGAGAGEVAEAAPSIERGLRGEVGAVPLPDDPARVAQGVLGATLQGLTFGASEELGAAVRSIPALVPGGETPKEAFARNVEQARAGLSEFREEHPVASTLSTVGGAVGQGIVAAPLLGARLVVGGAKGAAALVGLGAAEGALTAAGTAEGGIGERLGAVPVGAAAGAAGAGAGLGLGALLRAGGRRALDFFNLRPATEAVPGVSGVAARAESRLSEALPEDLGGARATIKGSTRPLSVLDVDENVRSLARAARGLQGESRESLAKFLGGRVEGQEQRVLDDALRLTGLGERSSIIETSQSIITRRAETAAPLYEAAYQRSVPREVLGDLLDDKPFRDAYQRGVRIAKREGVDITPIGELLPEGEGLVGPLEIPIQAIDYMKRGMDDLIEVSARSARGMGRQEARGLRNQLRDLLERVDEVVPEYAEARSAFAGESRMLDALEQGKDLWKLDPTEARQIIKALPASEREMFVRGGVESLAARVEDASATFDITTRRPLAARTRDRQRLRLLFPSDDAFDEFVAGLTDEAQIAATRRFIEGGSQTADKLAGLAEFAGVDIADIAALTSGNVPSLLGRMAQRTVLGRRNVFLGRLGEELTPSFTATGPDAVIVLDRIARLRQGVGRELSVRDAAIAVGAGAVAGRAVGEGRDRPGNR